MPNPSHESEWLTRKKRIDPKLKALGWTVIPFDENADLANYSRHAIEEYPTANGPADYGLVVDGRLLGVVEAKKLSLGPQGVLLQAERYSKGVADSPFNFRGYRVPFLFSTNGEVIWFHDVRHELELSRKVADFFTPTALAELMHFDAEAVYDRLRQLANNHPRLRRYQIEANAAVEEAMFHRKRQMLVAMATGTGKTFTTVNQIYRLMKSGAAKRVLFLVDRRALAAQAVRAFAAFEPEPGLKFDHIYEVYSQRFQTGDFDDDEPFDPKVLPKAYLENPTGGHAFVYVCTIQRMTINLFGRQAVFQTSSDEEIDEDAEQLSIPIHAFDFIVADECHRGYTTGEVSVWRDTLNHFDAIRVGLTATPAAHTKAYFKDVVYRYEYERAVREGYLVDYDAVKVQSDVRMNGVFLNEGEEVEMVDPDSGAETRDSLEDERQFDTSEVERKVTSPDSNRKVILELKKYADEHEAADRPLSQDAHLCRQRLAAHFARRPTRRNLPRGIWPGRIVRPQDYRPRRPAIAADSRVSQPQATGHRRDGRPAHDGRRYSRPGVHRLPADGEVPHSLRANARTRHPQGRAPPRQVALRRLRLLRWDAARILPQVDGHHGGTAGQAGSDHPASHRGHLEQS